MSDLGHIVVSGGAKGIGKAITETLVSKGYKVSIFSRSEVELDERISENAKFFKSDVTDYSHLDTVVNSSINWAGPITGLVNNVGRSEWKKLDDITVDFWNQMMAVNAGSSLFLTQAVAKASSSLKSVVNISSLAAKRGSANNTVYCAGKFAMNGITQSLAKELGGQGIRVNAVCPVYVKTEGVLDALSDSVSPSGDQDIEEYFQDFASANSALKRLPEGFEVGNTCAFLLSSESSAITGQCINVDCGVLPQ